MRLCACALLQLLAARFLNSDEYTIDQALEDISDRSRDLIFELVRSKADDLLAGMEFVNMEPTSMRRQAHPYADDLINYLRVGFLWCSVLVETLQFCLVWEVGSRRSEVGCL